MVCLKIGWTVRPQPKLWSFLLGCWDFNFLPTSGLSTKPLKVKLWVKTNGIQYWLVGEFTHVRTYFSGDWDVHWGYGILSHMLGSANSLKAFHANSLKAFHDPTIKYLESP